jgi:hypothetical protein
VQAVHSDPLLEEARLTALGLTPPFAEAIKAELRLSELSQSITSGWDDELKRWTFQPRDFATTNVYLMTDGTAYKIGQAINVAKRRSEIQTGNPRKVEVVATRRAPTWGEEAIHVRVAHLAFLVSGSLSTKR